MVDGKLKTTNNKRIIDVKLIFIITLLLSIFFHYSFFTTAFFTMVAIKQDNSVIPMPILPCNHGPYIWDKSLHHEGIGSTFNNRRYSFIAQGILKAKWIGNLWNSHEKSFASMKNQEESSLRKIMEDTSKYFGLHYSECNYDSLTLLEKQKRSLHRFLYTKKKKCSGDKIFKRCLDNFKINEKTVIVFDWEDRRSDYGYATFNEQFRYVLKK